MSASRVVRAARWLPLVLSIGCGDVTRTGVDASRPETYRLDASREVPREEVDAQVADASVQASFEPVGLDEADWMLSDDADASVQDEDMREASDAGVVVPRHEPRWVTTWSTAVVEDNLFALFQSFSRVTLRQVVHGSIGGERVRVRLSNRFGKKPLHIGAAHIAPQSVGSSIIAESDRILTFSGKEQVTIAAGQAVVSDPAALRLAPLTNIAVSLYFPQRAMVQNIHREASQTSYLSATGNYVGRADLPEGSALTSWFYLEGVEVESTTALGTVVAFGDSITDGFASSVDGEKRWPDELARRLLAAGQELGIANEGYAGNQILAAGAGEAALARFEHDVLGNAGVTHVIVAEGINDIGLSNASAEQVIDGLKQLIDKAHGRGLFVVGGTLVPFQGSFFHTDPRESARLSVNEWIRSSGAYDGFVDFEIALRDSLNASRLLPAYDSGDHLHPSDLGYEVMGQAVDLGLLVQSTEVAMEPAR